jgi:hypothetical protein
MIRGGHSPRWAAEPEKINNKNGLDKSQTDTAEVCGIILRIKREEHACDMKSVKDDIKRTET